MNLKKAKTMQTLLATINNYNRLMLDDSFDNEDKQFFKEQILKCYDKISNL